MRNNITCERCGHKFSSADIKIIDRILDKENDVREEYFKCPKCKTKYTILITDPEVRKLISAGKRDEARQREIYLKEQFNRGV